MSISATLLQPNRVTAAKPELDCPASGSMATPAGYGVGEQAETSTLCSTVKSSALLIAPLPSCTWRAKRCADDSREDATVTSNSRSHGVGGLLQLPASDVLKATFSRHTLEALEKPFPKTVNVCGKAEGVLPSLELTTYVLGLD